jgi:hemolysin activation/secretion protein
MRFWKCILIPTAAAILCSASAQETDRAAPGAVLATNAPSPKFEVRAYAFEGETILSPEKLSGILSNYTGIVDLPRVHAGLNKLQRFYELEGVTNISVTMPQQTLADGIVHVKMVPRPAQTVTNLAAKPAPKLAVTTYRIEGNTVLPARDFGVLSNYTGTNVTFPELREGLGKLQLRYRELGFPTINVSLPQQKLTNGIVRVKVIEGKLSDIVVSGNRYFSSNNIRRALPGLTTNILLNTKWFQPELDQANADRDRQIYPVISPGFEPGTTTLELKVKDQLPLHGRMEINDKSSPGTPLLRLDTAVQYGNLWQREQQMGFDYNFSPQEYKPAGSVNGFYDLPLVTSYSTFYRIPFGFGHSRREELAQKPANFGFDEVAHQFVLPPPSGHPDLTLYASRSASGTPVRYGPLSIIFTNALANIGSRSGQQSFTFNNNIGAKFNFPLAEFAGVHSAFSLGVDFKSYSAPTFSTNLTYFSLYAIDSFGNPVLVTNDTIRLPSNSSADLQYLPLSFGWSGARPDPWGSFAFSYSQSIFLQSLASSRTNFQIVAGAPGAGGNYTTINAGLARDQKLFGNWSALLNVNGQWASAPLINNEQFALGGTGGVRGYQQGEIYGDTGWRALFDLRAPPINLGYFPTANGSVPAVLRYSWFMDYGQTSLINRPTTANLSFSQWGTGLALFLSAGEHFDARLTLAWALTDTPTTTAGTAQAYFSVGAQF